MHHLVIFTGFCVFMLQSLMHMTVMAAIRLDERPDKIENVLFSLLMDGTVTTPSQSRSVAATGDPLASSTWEEV